MNDSSIIGSLKLRKRAAQVRLGSVPWDHSSAEPKRLPNNLRYDLIAVRCDAHKEIIHLEVLNSFLGEIKLGGS
jgi:hypothetical protein